MAVKGGDKLERTLKGIGDRLERGKGVKVGFLSGADYPDGTPVALVAAMNNYGAPGAGVPARPFFSNMVRDKQKNWGPSMAAILKQTDYDAAQTLGQMGEGIKGQLQQSILDTNSPPLAQATIDAKGFSKPLIDTNHMHDSAAFEVVGE